MSHTQKVQEAVRQLRLSSQPITPRTVERALAMATEAPQVPAAVNDSTAPPTPDDFTAPPPPCFMSMVRAAQGIVESPSPRGAVSDDHNEAPPPPDFYAMVIARQKGAKR